MSYKVVSQIGMLIMALLFGCSPKDDSLFDFGVSDQTGNEVTDVIVTFSDLRHWDMGVAEPNGYKSIGLIPGPIPDAADVRWTDSNGGSHSKHVQITPLPPPTRTSYMAGVRVIAFVIHADGSVELVGHSPLDKE